MVASMFVDFLESSNVLGGQINSMAKIYLKVYFAFVDISVVALGFFEIFVRRCIVSSKDNSSFAK
ncbi:hypothetical protein NXC24_PB00097 (plasmid) [Rhizobium sp. NXC24]|nr:hypothetical protein NXC24_PB00097 [Rhizobium sp. NXC24]